MVPVFLNLERLRDRRLHVTDDDALIREIVEEVAGPTLAAPGYEIPES